MIIISIKYYELYALIEKNGMQAAHLILSFAGIIKSTMKKLILIAAFTASVFGLSAQQMYPPNADVRADVDPAYAPFYHGVASGDPLSDRVIIWTRVSDQTGTVNLTWRMALDTAFANVVANGNTSTDSSSDFCVKVDVTGLQANTWYYYQFNMGPERSLIGRTRTLPVGDIDSLRFALMSCQDYESGYYNAHANIVNRNDVDAVVFVGDYIYEYGSGGGDRAHEPDYEILNLDDYRTRHSQYKLDPDLRRAMQQYPWICVWDDHEIANNGWKDGAENHTPGSEGDWLARRNDALKTYFDWMPVRKPDPNAPERIYRNFRWGNLVDLMMLDTRFEGRDEQLSTGSPELTDTNRTILGVDQRNWLLNQMDTTTAKWKILGQQVMVAPLRAFGQPVNLDQWDGYPADRDRLYNKIMDNNIQNVVVLTGDIHTAWANDLPLDGYDENSGANSAGVEFVCSSITSGNGELALLNTIGAPLIQSFNSHMKFVDVTSHGYTIIDINKTRTQGDFYATETLDEPNPSMSFSEGWYVNNNERFLRQNNSPSVRVRPNPVLAPPLPADPTAVKEDNADAVIFGMYPNPVQTQMVIQYYLYKNEPVTIQVYDMQGKVVYTEAIGKRDKGLNFTQVDLTSLSAGNYVLALQMPSGVHKRFVVKM
jgi:alkaline phosphatase D